MLQYEHVSQPTPSGAHRRRSLPATGGPRRRPRSFGRSSRPGSDRPSVPRRGSGPAPGGRPPAGGAPNAGAGLAGDENRALREAYGRLRRFLYDTNVFVYAVGRSHHYQAPCRDIVRLAAEGALRGEASVEVLHEFAHVRARRTEDRSSAAQEARAIAALCTLLPVTLSDVRLGLSLFDAHAGLQARDALFAATALNRDIDAIVSTDTAFDDVPGLERIDPTGAAALL